MGEQQSGGIFLLEGQRMYGHRWVELARVETHQQAYALFEGARRKFPRYQHFRMSRVGRILWKNFRD